MKNGNFNCRHWEKIIVVDQSFLFHVSRQRKITDSSRIFPDKFMAVPYPMG
jgi:hypothetical protein